MMKRIELTRGRVALVDDEDFEHLSQWKWYVTRIGRTSYATRTENRRTIYMHKVIVEGENIDHVNGDGLDNRKLNLRGCTHIENRRNSRTYSNNRSGFKGVSWYKNYQKWEAYLTVNRRKKKLGYFDSLVKAACAYDDAARKYFGEFAKVNFPRW